MHSSFSSAHFISCFISVRCKFPKNEGKTIISRNKIKAKNWSFNCYIQRDNCSFCCSNVSLPANDRFFPIRIPSLISRLSGTNKVDI